MKSNYIVRAQKFMEVFYPYMRKYNIEDAVAHFNEDKHRAVQFRCGAVRRVLVTSDYVVKWDYDKRNSKTFGGCRDEYNKYQKIKNDYYGYLFAEITPIKVNSRVFYVMPRVKSLGYDCGDWITDVLSETEWEYVESVTGDVHDENWGYLRGRPVIIDYACGTFDAAS